MKTKRTRSKLSDVLSQLFEDYRWAGTWPAFPLPLRILSCDDLKRLPDIPVWKKNIYINLFKKILPPQKGVSLIYYAAAMRGYVYAAVQRDQDRAMETYKISAQELVLESSEDVEGVSPKKLARAKEQTLNRARQQIVNVLTKWKLPMAADYLQGFAYGIECQAREEGWEPSPSTEVLKIYKVLLQQPAIEQMISAGRTVKELGELVAEHLNMDSGMTYAEYFSKNPDSKNAFLRNIQKIFERLELSVRRSGRPRGK